MSVFALEVGRRSALDLRTTAFGDAWAERGLAHCFRELAGLRAASQRLVEVRQSRAAHAGAGR